MLVIEVLRNPREGDPHVEQRVIQVEHQAVDGGRVQYPPPIR